MNEILHRVIIENSPEAVYHALTTQDGLSAWWTQAQARPQVGGIARFVFGPVGEHVVDMQIMQLVPNERVAWKCVAGPWVDTGEFSFDIQPDEHGTAVEFAHRGWKDPGEFFMHCNCKWGFFLGISLKSYLETGKGKPHPEDPAI